MRLKRPLFGGLCAHGLGRFVRNPAALVAVLLLAACAQPTPPAAPSGSPYSRDIAEAVYAAGFSAIHDKYIEPLSMGEVVLEGVRGLASLAPGLAVGVTDKAVQLTDENTEFAVFPLPTSDDLAGWTTLASNVTSAARTRTTELYQASAEQIFEAVFDGALGALDRFSRYAGAGEASKNRARRDGFDGIGVRIAIEGQWPVINQVLRRSPAAEAGLRVGDRLLSVGSVDTHELSQEKVAHLLRGKANTLVRLALARKGLDRPLQMAVTRKHVVPETVSIKQDGGILILAVSGFNQNTTTSLSDAIIEARKQTAGTPDGLTGVVLDLRGNPGGLLKQAVDAADLFLVRGGIISTRGRHGDSVQYYEAGGTDITDGLPIIVLIDGKSASAAEILAAALQDRNRAVIVGTTSFGKGTVQTVVRLPNDGEMTLTWSRLMAPSGYLLHGLGVMPTICTSNARAVTPTINAGMARRARTAGLLSDWRRTALADKPRRGALRLTCAAERHTGKLDVAIAKQLLTQPALYAGALDLSANLAEAPQDQLRKP